MIDGIDDATEDVAEEGAGLAAFLKDLMRPVTMTQAMTVDADAREKQIIMDHIRSESRVIAEYENRSDITQEGPMTVQGLVTITDPKTTLGDILAIAGPIGSLARVRFHRDENNCVDGVTICRQMLPDATADAARYDPYAEGSGAGLHGSPWRNPRPMPEHTPDTRLFAADGDDRSQS